LSLAVLALGVTVSLAPAANALGVIFSETYNYGKEEGQRDPGGNDVLEDGYMMVNDRSSERFSDAFDFSGASYQSIGRFDLTLTFSRASDKNWWGPKEKWYVRVPGSDSSFTGQTSGDNSGSSNDYFGRLNDSLSAQTFTLSAATDISGGDNAFSEALSIEKFIFGFAEYTAWSDEFELESAQLDIVGVVPLPAAAWILGGIAGLGLVAGRRKRAA
jgi:hypothetical protein